MNLLRKSLLISGGQILVIFLNMIVGIVYSRLLGSDGMGQYELFRSTALIVSTLCGLGLGIASIYFINRQKVPVREVVGTLLQSGVLLGLVLSGILSGLFVLAPGYFGRVPLWVAAAFALGVGMQLVKLLLRPVLVAQLAAWRVALVDTIEFAVVLVYCLALAFLHSVTPPLALLGLAAGSAASLALVLVFLREHLSLRHRVKWPLLLELLKVGVKFAAASVFLVIGSNITLLLLQYVKPGAFSDVGLYGRATTICSLVVLIPRATGQLLYAKWSLSKGPERNAQVELTIRTSLGYGLAAAALLWFFGREIIVRLYGEAFVGAQVALPALSVALIAMMAAAPLIQLLASDNRSGVTALILLGSVLITGAVTLLAVPGLGINGAAWGALGGNLFMLLLLSLVCARSYGLRPLAFLPVYPGDLVYLRQALFGRRPAGGASQSHRSTASFSGEDPSL